MKIVIIILILCGAYLWRYVKQQNIYEKNPGLLPPRRNYDINVSITPEQKTKYEADLKKYDTLIKDFKPTTGSQEIDFGSGVKWTAETIQKPEAEWFYEKARALEYLWRYTESIKTLNKLFTYYQNSAVARNNLGAMYANLGEYKYAIMNFKKLVEVFGDPYNEYTERIIRLYIDMGNGQEAGRWYVKYEENGGVRNEWLINQIKELNK